MVKKFADDKYEIVVYGTGFNAVKWVFLYEQQGGKVQYF